MKFTFYSQSVVEEPITPRPKTYTIAVSDFNTAVKLAEWGTYGPNGNQPLQHVRLVDCSTDHLKNILKQVGNYSDYGQIIQQILKDRQ